MRPRWRRLLGRAPFSAPSAGRRSHWHWSSRAPPVTAAGGTMRGRAVHGSSAPRVQRGAAGGAPGDRGTSGGGGHEAMDKADYGLAQEAGEQEPQRFLDALVARRSGGAHHPGDDGWHSLWGTRCRPAA
jgi:hypothetical protein